MTELEKKIVSAIQGDMPITERPYRRIAESLDMSEDEFLTALSGLCEKGVVRRFGATLRHQRSGFEANAMAYADRR